MITALFYFSVKNQDLGTTELISIILYPISLLTLYLARLQFQANHAPVITITSNKLRQSNQMDESRFNITVKNLGNGVCIDSFLLLKEKDVNNRTQYYMSKPEREIQPDTAIEFTITKEESFEHDVQYMLVYMDFFGHKYLASNVHRGRKSYDYKHLERLTQPSKQLFFLHPIYLKFLWWRHKAIKQQNTYRYQHLAKIKATREQLKGLDLYFEQEDKTKK